ncbi:MAG: hypothetical protein ACK4SO_06040, partial [Candidatus Kapaibacteriota bacterium]
QEHDRIILLITEPKELKVGISKGEFNFYADVPIDLQNLYFAYEQEFVIGIDLASLFHSKDNFIGSKIELLLKTENEFGEITYPIDGVFTYFVL